MAILVKINVFDIIKNHIKTLVNANTNKAGLDDWFTFFLVPILITYIFYACNFKVNQSSVETLVGAISIFVGLLFNAMVILLDVARKLKDGIDVMKNDNNCPESVLNMHQSRLYLIKSINTNISFSMLVSFMIIFVMLFGLIEWDPCIKDIVTKIITAFTVFLLSIFLLTFLMILKRLYYIFGHITD